MTEDIFAGTRGPRNARIMIVGEVYGAEEHKQQMPFVGATGRLLCGDPDHAQPGLLHKAGLQDSDIFYTNVVNAQPPRNDPTQFYYPTAEGNKLKLPKVQGLFARPAVLIGLDTLEKVIKAVNPQLVIAFGNYALWALTDNCVSIKDEDGYKKPIGIHTWNGSQTYTSPRFGARRLLPVIHPAQLFRAPEWTIDIVHALSRANLSQWDPDYTFTLRPTVTQVVERLEWFFDRADAQTYPLELAHDFEWAGNLVTCMSFAWSVTESISIPWRYSPSLEPYWTALEKQILFQLIRKVFLHPNITIIGQNYISDVQFLHHEFLVVPQALADTMIAEHVMFPGRPKGLDYLSGKYCKQHCYWGEASDHKDSADLWRYNCEDTARTYEIWQAQRPLLSATNQLDEYKWKMREWNLALQMFINGVRVDPVRRSALLQESLELEEKLATWLASVLPASCAPEVTKAASPWYSSTAQQMTVFYDLLGLPKQTKRLKSQVLSTMDKEALKTLAIVEPALSTVFNNILTFRSNRQLRTHTISKAVEPDGRMRAAGNVAGTVTMRWSTGQNSFGRAMNMQNITEGDEDD